MQARIEALLAERRFAEAAPWVAALPGGAGEAGWSVRARLVLAQEARDFAACLALGERLRACAPGDPLGYNAPAAMLRVAGRLAEAEALIAEGLARLPEADALLIEAASIATEAGRTALALARWEAVRSRMPHAPIGYINAAGVHTRQGEMDRARDLLAAGLAAVGPHRGLLVEAARHAGRQSRWADAQAHWEALFALLPDDAPLVADAVRAMFGRRFDRPARRGFMLHHLARAQAFAPGYGPVFLLQIEVLRDAGLLAEAAAFGAVCRRLFGGDEAIAVACANVEGERRRPAEGVRLLEAARTDVAPGVALEAALVRLLCQAGELDAAGRACDAALARLPADAALIEQHITLATRHGDFEEAARRCAHWRQSCPSNLAVQTVIRRLSVLSAEPAPAPAPLAADGGAAALFARFESLGATGFGCEFGMVQRHFGADPIGLLRWGNIGWDGLVRAIGEGFAGMGEAENTLIQTRPAEGGEREYFLADPRYGYLAHTFIRVSEAPQDRVHQQAMRRMRFLAGKLLEDMAQAEKIFVFKAPDYAGDEPLLRLFAALRARGPCRLVCVVLGDGNHPGGTVENLRPGLFLGRVATFNHAGTGGLRGVDLGGWRAICAVVTEMCDGVGDVG